MIYGCDLGTLHKKLELGNLPAKEMKKVILFVCGLQVMKVIVCLRFVGRRTLPSWFWGTDETEG